MSPTNLQVLWLHKLRTAETWIPFFKNHIEWLKACAIYLTGRSGGIASRLIVSLRLAGDSRPLYLRCASSDFVTFQEIFMSEEYACVLQYCPETVRGVLDVGANVGFAARWFQQRWPAALIVAVEPDGGNVGILRRNLQAKVSLNQPSPKVIRAFLGGTARHATIVSYGKGFANEGAISDQRLAGGGQVIPVVLGADLIAEAGGCIDLIKMDIEGAEKEVLEGDVTWLDESKVLVLEVHAPLDAKWLAEVARRQLPDWLIAEVVTRRSNAAVAVLVRQAHKAVASADAHARQ